ncbi:MAG: Methenyltetrahydromethanopterin cyclohydrolase [Gammaproteobacteria bacterium]|nr:MAG: Methenyltetrahydromethanopterin cyclohydrolase [Gammaproteobacteria bacterium]|tara:strand:+ start:1068 stop:2036 length:969 start_codon:yes stop_codon:yes gene_type:complete
MSENISINKAVKPLVEKLVENAELLNLGISTSEGGAKIIDAGINNTGCLESGRLITEICMGGLGRVSLSMNSNTPNWPLSIHVHSTNPVLSCLASQYAGWNLSFVKEEDNFNALGSGPCRALALKEDLFKDLKYSDKFYSTVVVLEVDRNPPQEIIDKITSDCDVSEKNLTIILTPTKSLSGSVQVVGRVLEVGMHKLHEIGFPLNKVIDGFGSAPVPPPAPDFLIGMGRTNDAILYGGVVHLFVDVDDDEAYELAKRLPSSTSSDYGKPFADIFKEYKYDFYKIDKLLFSPAKVIVTTLKTGKTFTEGTVNNDLVDKSFNK